MWERILGEYSIISQIVISNQVSFLFPTLLALEQYSRVLRAKSSDSLLVLYFWKNCLALKVIQIIIFRLDNYLRGCSWAPDGLCILSNSNDNILRLFNLPSGLLTGQLDNVEPEMKAILRIPEGEAIYDYSWWPLMNSMDPPTCCFVSTAKGQPIHLFDAFNGKLRATYRIIVSWHNILILS